MGNCCSGQEGARRRRGVQPGNARERVQTSPASPPLKSPPAGADFAGQPRPVSPDTPSSDETLNGTGDVLAELAELLSRYRAIVCGSYICSHLFKEVVSAHVSEPHRGQVMQFVEGFQALLTPSMREEWQNVVVGKLQISPESGVLLLEGWADARAGGMLQGEVGLLYCFLAQHHDVRQYLARALGVGPDAHDSAAVASTREALDEVNAMWCRKHGWIDGSAQARQERMLARQLSVQCINLEKRYSRFGSEWRELIDARDHLLRRVTEAVENLSPVMPGQVARQNVAQVCRLAHHQYHQLPANQDVDMLHRDYVHFAEVLARSLDSVQEDVRAEDEQAAEEAAAVAAVAHEALRRWGAVDAVRLATQERGLSRPMLQPRPLRHHTVERVPRSTAPPRSPPRTAVPASAPARSRPTPLGEGALTQASTQQPLTPIDFNASLAGTPGQLADCVTEDKEK
eukprot:TRINITY_DN6787_c0_g1_i1.p1 TRINITY_DN6787_c0_g1~~TRINITY_DN6787_c0_g1_i1.p1  ORF type:complete len:483 (+),score=146.65 TRINITY_DN6787_c0_g1_i1:80-1450(+)